MTLESDKSQLSSKDTLDLYRQGKKEWNDWVQSNPSGSIDFSAIELHSHIGKQYLKDNEISFHGFNFPNGGVSFNSAKIHRKIIFIDCNFGKGPVSFIGAEFRGGATFESATFGDGDVSFERASFASNNFSFLKTNFGDGLLNFNRAKFSGGTQTFNQSVKTKGTISFQGSEFTNCGVSIENADYRGCNCSFEFAKFSGSNIRFDGTEFEGEYVSFEGAKFESKIVSFTGVRFGVKRTVFKHALFSSDSVSFRSADFGYSRTDFSNAQFATTDVSFSEALFLEGNLFFTDATFASGRMDFSGINFEGARVNFHRVRFDGGNIKFEADNFRLAVVNFTQASFGKGTFSFGGDFSGCKALTFQGANFESEIKILEISSPTVLNFCQTRLSHPIDLDRVDINFLFTRVDEIWKKAIDANDSTSFRRLKKLAKESDDHNRALDFYAKEMRTSYWHSITGFRLVLYLLYDWFSNYGRSIWRPSIALAALTIAVAFLYLEIATSKTANFYDSLIFSLGSAIPFYSGSRLAQLLGSSKLYGEKVIELSGWVPAVSIAQGFLSGIFIFLIILALRNTFRS